MGVHEGEGEQGTDLVEDDEEEVEAGEERVGEAHVLLLVSFVREGEKDERTYI